MAVTLLGPLAMVAILVIPALLTASGADDEVRLVILDDSSYQIAEILPSAAKLLGSNLVIEEPDVKPTEQKLRRRIQTQEIDGYLLVPGDIDDGGVVRYRGDNATNLRFVNVLYLVVNESVQRSRAARAGLATDVVASLFQRIDFEHEHDTGTGAVDYDCDAVAGAKLVDE